MVAQVAHEATFPRKLPLAVGAGKGTHSGVGVHMSHEGALPGEAPVAQDARERTFPCVCGQVLLQV